MTEQDHAAAAAESIVSAGEEMTEAAAHATQSAEDLVTKAVEAQVSEARQLQHQAQTALETTVEHTHEDFAKGQAQIAEAASAAETSLGAARNALVEFNVRAIENWKTSADAQFEFWKRIAGARTLSEVMTLNGEFTRQQFEALSAHTKELTVLARKIAHVSAAPLQAQLEKAQRAA